MKRNTKGQVTVEVAVLFTFVIGALVFMGFYVQRAVQGAVKGNADSFGQQLSGLSGFNSVASSESLATEVDTKTNSCTTYDHNTGVDMNADGLISGLDVNKQGTFSGVPETLSDLSLMACDPVPVDENTPAPEAKDTR